MRPCPHPVAIALPFLLALPALSQTEKKLSAREIFYSAPKVASKTNTPPESAPPAKKEPVQAKKVQPKKEPQKEASKETSEQTPEQTPVETKQS